MATTNTVRTDTLDNVGGTITYSYDDNVGTYVLDGTAEALAGNWTITSSAGDIKGTTYNIRYNAIVTLGAFNVTIFGVALNSSQALKQAFISVYYDGSGYQVDIAPDFQDASIVTSSNIVAGAITTAKLDDTGGSEAVTTGTIRALAVTTAKINNSAVTTAKLDTTGAAEAVTTATMRDLNVTTAKINDLAVTTGKLNDLAVTNDKIADGTIASTKFTAATLALINTSGIQSASLSIVTADVLTLNTIPKELVAAPGAGNAIEVISWFTSLTWNTAAYATNTQLSLTSGTLEQGLDSTILLNVASEIQKGELITGGNLVSNAALNVKVKTGNPTLGDSGIKVYCLYRIVSL